MSILKKMSPVLFIMISFAVSSRIALSFLPSFEIDEFAYRYFSAKLAHVDLNNFFSSGGVNLNAIGYFYPLWIVGLIKESFFPSIDYFSKNYDVLLKIPAALTDILSGLIIYFLVKKKWGEKLGILGFLVYVFNPAIFFNSSIWGQYDSISTLFLLLALLAIIRKNTFLMASFFAIALIFKPQAIFFAPIATILTLTSTKPKQWLIAICSFVLTTLFLFFPFFPKNPILGIYYVNSSLANLYSCTSCFAYNFWGIFGNWQDDLNLFLGIPKISWGIILLIMFLSVFFLKKPIKIKFQYPYIFLTSALCIMAFYTFLTRMHDRYLFAFFPFLLLATFLLKSRILMFFYIFMSGLYFLNQYYVYIYYNVIYPNSQNILFNSFLYQLLDKNFKNLSLISTLTLLCATLIIIKFGYEKIK